MDPLARPFRLLLLLAAAAGVASARSVHAEEASPDPAPDDGAVTVLGTGLLRQSRAVIRACVEKVAAVAAGVEIATVRVHSGCVTGDIFHSLRCDCRAQLEAALERIIKTPNGVLIYLPYHEGRGIGLFKKIRAYSLQDQGLDTVDANLHQGAPIDARDYELAARILTDLGFEKIRLMTNNPAKVEALRAHGIDVVEQISLIVRPSVHNKRYLETKRRRMAHKL